MSRIRDILELRARRHLNETIPSVATVAAAGPTDDALSDSATPPTTGLQQPVIQVPLKPSLPQQTRQNPRQQFFSARSEPAAPDVLTYYTIGCTVFAEQCEVYQRCHARFELDDFLYALDALKIALGMGGLDADQVTRAAEHIVLGERIKQAIEVETDDTTVQLEHQTEVQFIPHPPRK